MKAIPFKDLSGRIVLPSPGASADVDPADWPHELVSDEELRAAGWEHGPTASYDGVPQDLTLSLPERVVDDFGIEDLDDEIEDDEQDEDDAEGGDDE